MTVVRIVPDTHERVLAESRLRQRGQAEGLTWMTLLGYARFLHTRVGKADRRWKIRVLATRRTWSSGMRIHRSSALATAARKLRVSSATEPSFGIIDSSSVITL